jgi:hypothetical protein
MKLVVDYRSAEPKKITSKSPTMDYRYVFTIESRAARLIDVRATASIESGESSMSVGEYNQVHDAILDLPFIDRVTVHMMGRTETTKEVSDDE